MLDESCIINRLEQYEDVSMELLAKRQLQKRTDHKYLARVSQLESILERLGDDYRLLRANGRPIAQYKSLYFDTKDLLCYHDHYRGRRPRFKVRIRQYLDRNKSVLEVKRKTNDGKTVKVSSPKDYDQWTLENDDITFVESKSNMKVAQLHRSLWVNFQRITLVGVKTKERLTIDLNLKLNNEDNKSVFFQIAIIELKQEDSCHWTPAMRAMRSCFVRPGKVSKYCLGVTNLYDGVRMNRFMPMLRAVSKANV